MPHAQIAATSVIAVRSGGRCEHCLAAIYEIRVGQGDGGEWLPAELVGEHYEIHDCQSRAWHASPASPRVF